MTGQDALKDLLPSREGGGSHWTKQTNKQTPQQTSAIYLEGKGRLLVGSGTLVQLTDNYGGLGWFSVIVEAPETINDFVSHI